MTIRRLHLLAAAALMSPLAAGALEGDVTIYGTFLPFADNARVVNPTPPGYGSGASLVPAAAYTGAAVPQRFRLTSGTSNLGFKGGLDVLGEDLQVFFQVESAVSPDGDAPNAWASRNSAVGVKGRFGRLLAGNWDTPYKYPGLLNGVLRGLNPFDNAITGNPGFNVPGTVTASGYTNAKSDASFSRRQGNSVQYWSPTYLGLSVRLAASVDETKAVPTAAGAAPPTLAGPVTSPALYSGLLSWAQGPFSLSYAYELHQDYFGLKQLGANGPSTTNRSSRDEGHEVAAQARLATGTRLAFTAERLSYANRDQAANAVDRYERYAIWALAMQKVAAHSVWLTAGKAGNGTCHLNGTAPCYTNGLAARTWSAGYSYAITQAADVYASYYETRNDHSGSYAVFPSPGTVAPGGDTRGVGVGLLVTFAATAKMGQPAGTP
jgi:predicted porin